MTKQQLLENEEFMKAPMDAEVEIPNRWYKEGVDERDDVTIEEVRYWDWKNLISFN